MQKGKIKKIGLRFFNLSYESTYLRIKNKSNLRQKTGSYI